MAPRRRQGDASFLSLHARIRYLVLAAFAVLSLVDPRIVRDAVQWAFLTYQRLGDAERDIAMLKRDQQRIETELRDQRARRR